MATKQKKRTAPQKGITKAIYEYIKSRYRPYEQFHNGSFEIGGVTPIQVSNALSYLKSKGLLEHGALKGYYCLPNGGAAGADPEKVVIDRLLDAMAAAEPILKKWSKVHEALKGV